ncbi:glycosyltransferase family 2 protein [Streptomyces sp. NPDC101151]|uniref:glycosyltransferase family 2 protein n=1 Tax=Streptomyces sp. NPDC101151 TaxID=3366115 RepID=UPI0037F1BF5A
MSIPDVTVVINVHNDAERLSRAVASVQRQTHTNLEIVISDDCSADETTDIAWQLSGEDPRVRVIRLEEHSGGYGAPRNHAMEIARAPYLMFLDSGDELPFRAVELLLSAHREQESDIAMGAVERIRAGSGQSSVWMPQLVAERRTLDGIESDPRLIRAHLSVGNMYARTFLHRYGLLFPEGIRYAARLFSAQAYCMAKALTIISEPVYRWHTAPQTDIQATQRLGDVGDLIQVQQLVHAFLTASCHESLREDRDYQFLRYDFSGYVRDLPFRDGQWLTAFADLVNPYLATLGAGVYARLPRAQRVVLQLIRDRRLADAQLASRDLGRAAAPRHTATDVDGRAYWGERIPETEEARRELDVSDLHSRSFGSAQFRHEIVEVVRGSGACINLGIRMYDPGLRLCVGLQSATLLCAVVQRPLAAPFHLSPVRAGVFEGRVTLDLAAVPFPLGGLDGVRRPLLRLEQQGVSNTGPLLAPVGLQPLASCIRYHRGMAPHQVTVELEGRGPGRLQVRWEPAGMMRAARWVASAFSRGLPKNGSGQGGRFR